VPSHLDKVVEEALSLSGAERLHLARRLLESVEPSADADAERLWEEEIERRIAQVDAGAAQGRPWEEIKKDFDSRFGG